MIDTTQNVQDDKTAVTPVATTETKDDATVAAKVEESKAD